MSRREDEFKTVAQFEKIAKAIRELEGLPVDFRLARKLSDVLADIAAMFAPEVNQ